jgi:hypothetical protein
MEVKILPYVKIAPLFAEGRGSTAIACAKYTEVKLCILRALLYRVMA